MRFTAITLAALTLTTAACATTSEEITTTDSDSTASVDVTTEPTEPAPGPTTSATPTTTTTTPTTTVAPTTAVSDFDRDAVTDEVMVALERDGFDLVRSCVFDKMTPEFTTEFAESLSPLHREVVDECYDYDALVDEMLGSENPGRDLFDRPCVVELFEDLGFVAYEELVRTRDRPAAFLIRCIDPEAFIATIPADLDAAQEECVRGELRSEEFITAYEEPDADSSELFRAVGRVCDISSTVEPDGIDEADLDQLVDGLRGQLPPGVEVESECVRAAFDDNGIDVAAINAGQLTEEYFAQLYDCFEPSEFAKIIVAQAEARGVDPSTIDAQCIAELKVELDLGALAAEAGDIPLGAFAECGVVIPD